MRVQRIGRDEFIATRWAYRPGEHATFIGKTQSGKTTLAFQLLSATATPDLQAIVLVMKPKDATPATWGRRIGLRRVATWPPPVWQREPIARAPGWLLWPRLGDIRNDERNLQRQFDRALASSYGQAARRNGRPRIVFADEVVGIAKELKLERELSAVWMRGSSMGLGLWAAGQRPFNMPQHAFSQSVHLFLHRDVDRRNVVRYREIGGVDPDLVQGVMTQMDEHEFLYIRRRDYTLCVVGT